MDKAFLIELDRYLLQQKQELFAGIQGGVLFADVPPPAARLGMPLEVFCRQVNGEGCWALMWNEVDGAVGYEVQTNPNPKETTQWRVAEMGTVPFFYFHAKPMETQVWIRVRALFEKAVGFWSDPVRLLADDLPWQEAA